MINIRKLFLLLGLALGPVLHTTAQDHPADRLFSEVPEVFFCFPNPGPSVMKQLEPHLSIDHGSRRDTVTAYANQRGFHRFLELEIPYRFLPHPGSQVHWPATTLTDWLTKSAPCQDSFDYYPSYELYETIMYDFAAEFPDLCRIVEFGVLPSGRKLLAAVISDFPDSTEYEPQTFYTASMHGDETAGFPLMLRLINHLLCRYGQEDRITQLVDNVEIWINPLANPDGTYTNNNATISGATRFNANGVDLNRNYPDPEDGPHPDGNAWQPETLAFMALADAQHFDLSANLHGGAEVCNYPWDTWAQRHADDDWWQLVCREYADTAQAYSFPGYMDYLDNGITNGYDWYTTAGNRQDHMNYFHHCREFTLEISNVKLLPAGQLDNFWNFNYRSFLNYLEQARYGLRGIVTDSLTGDPLAARVWVEEHDADSSQVYSRLPHGNYHRLLKAGNYTLTFSAPGYWPRTIGEVMVNDFNATVLDVALVPMETTAVAEQPASRLAIEEITWSEGLLRLRWAKPASAALHLMLFDAAGRLAGQREFPPGAAEGAADWSLPGFSPGVYFLQARSGGAMKTVKVIQM